MMWEIGSLSEHHLRLTAGDLFGGPLGRRYWREARDARRVAERGHRARSFHSIVESEFQQALRRHPDDIAGLGAIEQQVGPAVQQSPRRASSVAGKPDSLKVGLLLATVAVAGIAIEQLIGWRHEHRSR